MISPNARRAWITDYLRAHPHEHVDVLNRYFVDEYVEATGAPVDVMPYGADRCATLGRDLAALYYSRDVDRVVTGIEGMAGLGFPRWVYTYHLR